MVLLGEISFSLYLLHQILLRYYQANINALPHLPNAISLAIFWAIALLSSYSMWVLIEMPSRRLILRWGHNKIYGTNVLQESWRSNLNFNRKTISAAAILSCLLVLIPSYKIINHTSLSAENKVTTKESQPVVGARFGDLFLLHECNIKRKIEGLFIDFEWESLVDQELTYTNGVHLTDSGGKILVQADYKQSINRMALKRGTIWKDSIFISEDRLKGGESKLAIALYQNSSDLLLVDQGDRDWGNHRLLIPVCFQVETNSRRLNEKS